jgi:type I restriction enzyme S subunit
VARTYFSGSSKQTTNLASINKTQLRACPVALPPLAEQRRIIAKVNELITLCDALKAGLAEAQTTQTHLADAIVERAVAAPELSAA